ncbi:hypothetical protein BDV12DRAFT_194675 [Aspergillus spectabilis]
MSPELLGIHHIGNLYQPSGALNDVAVGGTFLAGTLLATSANLVTATVALPLAITVWVAGGFGAMKGAMKVDEMCSKTLPSVLGHVTNDDPASNSELEDYGGADVEFIFHATTRRAHRREPRGSRRHKQTRSRRAWECCG